MLSLLGSLLLKIITKPDPGQLIDRYGWAGAACFYIGIPLAIGFAAYFLLRKLLMNTTKNV
jgi:hypothetical protein